MAGGAQDDRRIDIVQARHFQTPLDIQHAERMQDPTECRAREAEALREFGLGHVEVIDRLGEDNGEIGAAPRHLP
jgi:hypothetical protein